MGFNSGLKGLNINIKILIYSSSVNKWQIFVWRRNVESLVLGRQEQQAFKRTNPWRLIVVVTIIIIIIIIIITIIIKI